MTTRHPNQQPFRTHFDRVPEIKRVYVPGESKQVANTYPIPAYSRILVVPRAGEDDPVRAAVVDALVARKRGQS